MGRLAGFSYKEVARRLRTFGFQFDRPRAGSHEVWRHPQTGRKVTLPHHSGDMAEGTPRPIPREPRINVSDFPKACAPTWFSINYPLQATSDASYPYHHS